MSRGLANASRMARSVISLKVTRWVLAAGTCAASATCQAIASPSRSRSVARKTVSAALGRLLDLGDLLAAVVGDDVLGREVVVDVDAELALAGVLGQVADVAVGGEDPVVVAEVALDRPRLGRRLDDHEVLRHGRECSTGSCTRPCHPRQRGGLRAARGGRARRARSDLADAAEEVLVDLEVLVGSAASAGAGRRRPRAASTGGLEPSAGDARRDLDEPDVQVREEEDRRRCRR